MEGTLRLMDWLERHAPACGLAGGLLFFLYWNGTVRDLGYHWALTATVNALSIVLLSAGLLGYQLAQGTQPRSWIGWAGVGAVLWGFAISPLLVCAGLVAFGLSIALCGVYPRVPGVMLAVGAAALAVATSYVPDLASEEKAILDAPLRVSIGVALLLVVGALADLGLDKGGHLHRTAA